MILGMERKSPDTLTGPGRLDNVEKDPPLRRTGGSLINMLVEKAMG
jgi:hypothetical protein